MTDTTTVLHRRGLFRLGGMSAVAIGGAAVLAACGNSTSAPSSPMSSGSGGSSTPMSFPALNVQLSWEKNIEFAGEYFAIEKGYYTAEGIQGMSTTNLLTGGSGPTAEQIVAQGQALVGLSAPCFTAPFNITAMKSGKKPLVAIATTYQKNPFCLLSLKEHTPIATLSDLVGKKVGVQSSNTALWNGFLAANNLVGKVTTIPTGYDIKALEQGDEDAHFSYLTNEPILAQMDKYTPVTLGFADNGLPFCAETYVVSQDTLSSQRDLLKAFLIAEIKGWTDAVKDPAQSAKYAVEKYGTGDNLQVTEQTGEAKAQNGLIVSDDTNKNGLLTISDDLISESLASMKAMKYEIDAKDMFDTSLIEEIYQENPDLIVTLPVTKA